MKLRNLFTLLAVLLAMPICFSVSPQKDTVIKISVKNLGDRQLSYTRSYSGVYDPNHLPLKLDADSSATIIVTTDGMESFSVLASDASRKLPNLHKSFWLQPGNISIFIDPAEEQPIVVKSASDKQRECLLPEELIKLGDLYIGLVAYGSNQDVLNIRQDSLPSVVINKIDNYIDSVCQKHNKGAKVDREIFRSNAELYRYLIFSAKYNKFKEEEGWNKARENLLRNTDLLSSYLGLFPYLQMAAVDMFYNNRWDEVKALSGDELLLAKADFYNTKFNGKMLEAALATLLLEDGRRGLYNVSAPKLTEQFKEKYPASNIIPLLEEQVVKNITFNNPPEREGVVFRENSDINSVADVLARYKGKPLLIDLWASWCRPCLESFSHVEPLQKYAVDNNLELLYISIDEQPDIERKWKNIALLNNLKGDHILINPAVKDEIYSTFGSNGYMFIPCYAFVAPDGTIEVLGSELAESKDFAVVKEELDKLLKR